MIEVETISLNSSGSTKAIYNWERQLTLKKVIPVTGVDFVNFLCCIWEPFIFAISMRSLEMLM